MAFDSVSPLMLATLCASGAGLATVLLLRTRCRFREAFQREQARAREELERQVEERRQAEDTLRRTLTVFQLLQDVTSAAGTARSVEEAIQGSLDIICSYTGWPVAHAFHPAQAEGGVPQLQATGIWHLESPHDYEAFLREGERKPLALGKGLPGKAWSSRWVAWSRYMDDPRSTSFFRRALEVGLTMGFAIPVFRDEELVCVLEFFSPPAPDPDGTMLNALSGVGEQLGRMAERLRAEEELAQLNRRLVELNEEKNQFLGIASHDLKNPLNAIGLMGELLASGDLPSTEAAELGRRVSGEAQRTTMLIQKLLDITAIESGRFNLHLGEVSLADALMHVQAKHLGRAEAKGQAIALDFGGQDVLVWADPEYVQEILDNLVSNALKFMLPGPPLRTVTLALSVEGERGIVEVRDEGPGFSEGDCQKAFGRFAKLSAKPTGGEHSTGLGLSIVRRLVQAMNGTVELESQLGRGSCFRIALPLAPGN